MPMNIPTTVMPKLVIGAGAGINLKNNIIASVIAQLMYHAIDLFFS